MGMDNCEELRKCHVSKGINFQIVYLYNVKFISLITVLHQKIIRNLPGEMNNQIFYIEVDRFENNPSCYCFWYMTRELLVVQKNLP